MRRRNISFFKLLLFCLTVAFLVFPAGCWDRREPNLYGIVTSAAFDFDPQTGLFHVIARLANPLGVSVGSDAGGNGGGGGGKSPFWIIETSGHTVYEAIKKTELVSTTKLLWTHLEVVLFTETMAREGLWPVLDYIDREREARLISRPFVVKGDIKDLARADFPLELFGGPALARQLTTIRLEDAASPEIDTMRSLLFHLSEPGMELALPLLEVQAKSKEETGTDSGGGAEPDEPNPAKISGAALFRDDKLVDFFNEKETAGYLWLTNNIRRLTMVFPCPGETDKFLTVEILEALIKLEPQVQGEKVRMLLSIRADGRLQDFSGHSLPSDDNYKNSLNRRMATVIRNQVAMAWRKARALNLDVFDFGHLLYQRRPQEWRYLGEKWEEIFPEIELEVDVRAVIRDYGLVAEPIRIR